jgi:hypothetical protein
LKTFLFKQPQPTRSAPMFMEVSAGMNLQGFQTGVVPTDSQQQGTSKIPFKTVSFCKASPSPTSSAAPCPSARKRVPDLDLGA